MKTIGNIFCLLSIFLTTTACGQANSNPPSFYDAGSNTGDSPVEINTCGMADGTYTAGVTFLIKDKPAHTGTEEIEVLDCKVVRIYFLKHRLDETNMSPGIIRNDSTAVIIDKKGNKYKVHILSGPAEDTGNYRAGNSSRHSSGGWHFCGCPTRKGTPCQHKVSHGRYCWQHGG